MSEPHEVTNSDPRSAGRWWLWLFLSAAVVITDQLTKAAVLSWLHAGEERIVTGFFSIVLAFNSGAAFSFLGDASGWQRYLFSAFAVAAAALIVWLLRRGGDRMYCAGLSLILGGALGNLLDRAFIGRVVDFILVHDFLPFRPPGGGWLDPFPAFNIADSAITIGAVLLIIDSFRQRRTGSAALR
jgi:signal peptidase II